VKRMPAEAEELREESGVTYGAYGGTAAIKAEERARGLVPRRTVARLLKEINYACREAEELKR